MGCCHSSPDERVQNISNSHVPAAPIVVTKAPSLTFESNAEPSHCLASSSPPPSIGDEPLGTAAEPEKKPVIEDESDRFTKSDVAVTSVPVAPPPPPQTNKTIIKQQDMEGPWSVIVRLSNTHQDIHVVIPTQEPYMTITQLKQHIPLEPGQHIKLIHLGHILKDASVLVPRTMPTHSSDTVQVSNQGVIQAMVYSSI